MMHLDWPLYAVLVELWRAFQSPVSDLVGPAVTLHLVTQHKTCCVPLAARLINREWSHSRENAAIMTFS